MFHSISELWNHVIRNRVENLKKEEKKELKKVKWALLTEFVKSLYIFQTENSTNQTAKCAISLSTSWAVTHSFQSHYPFWSGLVSSNEYPMDCHDLVLITLFWRDIKQLYFLASLFFCLWVLTSVLTSLRWRMESLVRASMAAVATASCLLCCRASRYCTDNSPQLFSVHS